MIYNRKYEGEVANINDANLCFVVPFLPKCFDDDDEEEKPDNTATQASLPLASLPAPRYDAALAGERRHGAQETPAPRGSEGLARDS